VGYPKETSLCIRRILVTSDAWTCIWCQQNSDYVEVYNQSGAEVLMRTDDENSDSEISIDVNGSFLVHTLPVTRNIKRFQKGQSIGYFKCAEDGKSGYVVAVFT
jgi:hypothetical protein